MPTVLGIDQSQTCSGWSVFKAGHPPAFGRIELPQWGNEEGKHLATFYDTIAGLIVEHGVTHVFYEQTFIPMPRTKIGKRGKPIAAPAESFGNRYAQLALVAMIQMAAHKHGCKVYVARINDWRDRFIGTHVSPPSYGPGQASTRWFKGEAKTAANLLGWFTDNDNEAEALGIGHFGMCCVDKRYTENTNVHTARMQKRFAEMMRGER
jgi:hypothetical protein